MLSIRMQRLGRKGHPTYRMVVQDSRQSPTSGKYVALLGSYDPHTKTSSLQKDKVSFYLEHGAQPSDRVITLLTAEKVALPKWVKQPIKQERSIRNPEKLRRNRPDEPASVEPKAEEAAEQDSEENATAGQAEAKTEEAGEQVADSGAETEEKQSEATEEKPAEDLSEKAPEEPAEKEDSADEADKKSEKTA